MEKPRVLGLVLTLAIQLAMCVLHFVYVVYFLIMGMFSAMAMMGEAFRSLGYFIPLSVLLSYPVASAASVAVAWILFFREKKTFLPAVVSCYPALHLCLILLSYGLSA
jgi:hypothetical protein